MGLGYLTEQTPLTTLALPLLKVPLRAPHLGASDTAGPHPGPRGPLPSPPTSLLFSWFKSQITPFWHQPLPDPPQNVWPPAALPCPLAGTWNASLHRPLHFRSGLRPLPTNWRPLGGGLGYPLPSSSSNSPGRSSYLLQDQGMMPIAKGSSQLPRALPSTHSRTLWPSKNEEILGKEARRATVLALVLELTHAVLLGRLLLRPQFLLG